MVDGGHRLAEHVLSDSPEGCFEAASVDLMEGLGWV